MWDRICERERVEQTAGVLPVIEGRRKIGRSCHRGSQLEAGTGGRDQFSERRNGGIAPAVLVCRDYRLRRTSARGECGLRQPRTDAEVPDDVARLHLLSISLCLWRERQHSPEAL